MQRIIIISFLLLWQFTLLGQSATEQKVTQLLTDVDSLLDYDEFAAADSLLKIALPLAIKIKDLKCQARCWQNLGYVAEMWGDLPIALENYQVALKHWRTFGDSTGVGKTLRDLSIVKEMQGDYVSQVECAKEGYRAVAYVSESGTLRGDLAIDIGNAYANFGRPEEARQWFEEALGIHQENDDEVGISKAQYGLANLFYNTEELANAKKYIQPAILSFKKQEDTAALAQAQNVLGAIHLTLEEYDSANYYFQESVDNAEIAQDTLLLYDAYLNLALNAIHQDDTKKGQAYYNKATALYKSKASVFNNNSLEALEKNGLILETVLANKETKFYAAIVVSLIILLITLLSCFYFYRLQKKRKVRLQADQLKVEQEQEELRHTQEIDKLLKEINQQAEIGREKGEKEERQRLKKLVHNTIGSQLAATKWTMEPYIESSKDNGQEVAELENILKMIEKAFKNSRNIERLLDKENRNWMQEIEDFFLLLQRSKHGNPKIEFQRHGLDLPLPSEIGRWVSQMVKIIVANVLTHAQAKHFSCQMNLMAEELIIIAEDDGKGFELEEVKKNSDSSGIRNLEGMVNDLNGDITIDALPGKGTTTTITIPVEY